MPEAVTAKVPVDVTGDPATEKIDGIVKATDETVPDPDTVAQLVELPFVVRNCPAWPDWLGAKALKVESGVKSENFVTKAGVDGRSLIKSLSVVPSPELLTYGKESFVFTVDGSVFNGS